MAQQSERPLKSKAPIPPCIKRLRGVARARGQRWGLGALRIPVTSLGAGIAVQPFAADPAARRAARASRISDSLPQNRQTLRLALWRQQQYSQPGTTKQSQLAISARSDPSRMVSGSATSRQAVHCIRHAIKRSPTLRSIKRSLRPILALASRRIRFTGRAGAGGRLPVPADLSFIGRKGSNLCEYRGKIAIGGARLG
jgi:hypothetical protein